MAHDFRATEESNTKKRANLLRVKYFDVRSLAKKPMFPGLLTNEQMYEMRAVILSKEKGRMIVAITINSPKQALSEMRRKFQDYRVSYVMISDSAFDEFMLEYDPPSKVQYKDVEIKPDKIDESVKEVTTTLEQVRSDDVFNYLVRQGHKLTASDIHLETQEHDVQIRFRVDGVLHEIARITYDKYRQLSSTIAIHANISTDAPEPQTGHMNHKIMDDNGQMLSEVNMRIETAQTNFGQDAVIRIFSLEKNLLQLSHLGLNKREMEIIDDIIAHPSGLVLSVGPTGSGKTTTLYSILSQLNTVDRKLITLEDPVEYDLPGVMQIPVNTDQADSFTEKLRAVLRLDPDVIMIGEIRDADTAKTALQAALSGHLVLSTFHANDTAAALTRLYEFLGDNPLLTTAIRLIVAQRLVRKLDDSTKKEHKPDPQVIAQAKKHLSGIDPSLNVDLDKTQFYAPGTSDAVPFGYLGQTAVVELLRIDQEIESLLYGDAGIDPLQIREIAMKNGMVTLMQSAILKATKGETALEEVFRVM